MRILVVRLVNQHQMPRNQAADYSDLRSTLLQLLVQVRSATRAQLERGRYSVERLALAKHHLSAVVVAATYSEKETNCQARSLDKPGHKTINHQILQRLRLGSQDFPHRTSRQSQLQWEKVKLRVSLVALVEAATPQASSAPYPLTHRHERR